MPLTDAELGNRVGRAIRDSGKTQQEVAATIGIDATALSKAVAGKRKFSSLEFAQICDTLGESPLALLDDGSTPGAADAAVKRLQWVIELDGLLTRVGLPARRDGHWPSTLFDRAAEAYVGGHISIRPLAGLLGVDADELLDRLPKRT